LCNQFFHREVRWIEDENLFLVSPHLNAHIKCMINIFLALGISAVPMRVFIIWFSFVGKFLLKQSGLKNFIDIFGRVNVRAYPKEIPNVFLQDYKLLEAKLNYWLDSHC
jgi:cellulose synthase/poly-beta-1,6-N-acetylglucosamine synthase-like glycosyltransferase